MSASPAAIGTNSPLARLRLHLELGRISNLPTVWTNVLAAAVIGGASLDPTPLILAMAGFSALYIGGMYLNDVCDADIDARERADRPIPSGRITHHAVTLGAMIWFIVGVAMIGCARLLAPAAEGTVAWLPATLALLACIVVYDRHHKVNPYGPMLMASCRALVYVAAAFALSGNATLAACIGALLSFSWVAGLTAFAKKEGHPDAPSALLVHQWPLLVLALPALVALPVVAEHPIVIALSAGLLFSVFHARRLMRRRGPGDFPAAIGLLIAAISIVDALAIARSGHTMLALAAAGCMAITLLLQRRIAGT